MLRVYIGGDVGEGKSVLAKRIASLIAEAGYTVTLDCGNEQAAADMSRLVVPEDGESRMVRVIDRLTDDRQSVPISLTQDRGGKGTLRDCQFCKPKIAAPAPATLAVTGAGAASPQVNAASAAPVAPAAPVPAVPVSPPPLKLND